MKKTVLFWLVAFAAPAYCQPEINVIGNFLSIADNDYTTNGADHTDFGSVSIGSGSVTVTYTIQTPERRA